MNFLECGLVHESVNEGQIERLKHLALSPQRLSCQQYTDFHFQDCSQRTRIRLRVDLVNDRGKTL